MSSERRRRRTRQRRLRRFVFEYRLNAAEGVLACAGLAIGLWLFVPGDVPRQDVAGTAAVQEGGGSGAALANGLVPAAQANASISAKRSVLVSTAPPSGEGLSIGGVEPRLAKLARVMPEIGPPAPPASVAPLAGDLPDPADRDALVEDRSSAGAPVPAGLAAGADDGAPTIKETIRAAEAAADVPEAVAALADSPDTAPPPRDVPASAAIARAASTLGRLSAGEAHANEAPAAAVPTVGEGEAAVPPPRQSVAADASPTALKEQQLAALIPSPQPQPAVRMPVRPEPPAVQDGVPAWVRNAAAAPAAGDQRPMIAIMIDDLGPSPSRTHQVVKLPGPLTMAFLPYAGGLRAQTAAARRAGHELMVHMPMEPEGSEIPGPNALIGSLSIAEFKDRLHENLDVFDGFVGLNNHMGSALTQQSGWMALVMAELRRRDLLFVDSRTTPRSVGPVEALRYGVPFAQRDVFLDNDPTFAAIMSQLQRVEGHARRNGVAIAIGHPNAATIQALGRWLPTLAARGFRLVPVSSVVARNSCVEPSVASGCGPIRDAPPIPAIARDGGSAQSGS